MKIIGKLNWLELREFMLDRLENCKTEKQLITFLVYLNKSVGTMKELIKTRKELNLDTKDLEKLK